MQDLLFLCHRIPYPPDKGDKIRSWNMLRYLSQRYRVHLGCLIDDPNDWQHVPVLEEICGDTHFARLDPRMARLLSLRALADGRPLSLTYFHNQGLMNWVGEVMRGRRPRQALIYSSAMAAYVVGDGFGGLRRVVDMVDVDSDKWQQYAERKTWPMKAIYRREARTLLAFERRIAAAFDASLFVSPREAALFRDLAPESAEKIFHVNNGVDAAYFSPDNAYDNPYPAGTRALVFTGAMDYWPNVDAVVWFAEQLLPTLRQRFGPSLRFVVVGSNPSPEVLALKKLDGIDVTGRVPDVRPYVAHAAVAVAPLRVARGVQNKVLEAMAMARPVVASPQALEGIDATPGRHLLLGESAVEFMEAVVTALDGAVEEAPGSAPGSTLGRAARQRVLEAYGWDGNLARLAQLLAGSEDVVAEPPPAEAVRR